MIVTFPDKDFGHMMVEFNTETYHAVYVMSSGHRKDCYLSVEAWRDRLVEWNIDLERLIVEAENFIDEGL